MAEEATAAPAGSPAPADAREDIEKAMVPLLVLAAIVRR
jgi:hypothetical protein